MPAKPGDIVQFATSRGFAHAQLIRKKVAPYGSLLRVLRGFWETTPTELDLVARQPLAFYTFFPVDTALRRKLATRLDNTPIPDDAKPFPILRIRGRYENGKTKWWALWDGEQKRRIDQLTEEQKRLSIALLVNDTMLVERLVSDWRPEYDT